MQRNNLIFLGLNELFVIYYLISTKISRVLIILSINVYGWNVVNDYL